MFMLYLALIDDENDLMLFNKIYAQNNDEAYQRAYQVLNNASDTEDVLQDSWVIVCKRIKDFYGKSAEWTSGYIKGIVRNRARNHLRRQKREVMF